MEALALHYKEYGDQSAPLMVFLHGGGVSGWMWDRQIQYFTHYHCIVPDLPGHGHIPDDTTFSIKGSAQEIIDLIEVKSAGKNVILIGFSLGAQVAIQIISSKPHLVDFTILNSALVRPMKYANLWIGPTVSMSFPFVKNRWFSKLQSKTLYVSEDDFEIYYEETCQMKKDTLVRVLEENMSFLIPEGFHQVAGKILVTVGEKEKSIMKKSAKDLVVSNPNCTGVLIPNIGHGAPLAIPDFFNNMVGAWINEGTIPRDCKLIR